MADKDSTFDLKLASNGEFYFTLVAPNGEPIARSETYKTRQGALNGIEAVRKYAPGARLDDQT